MKVFLDDVRDTPEGWVRTYTVQETIDLLKTKKVTHLSLDNDLGIPGSENEGFQVIRYLEDLCDPRNDEADLSFPIPECKVHSSNSDRIKDMTMGIAKLHAWKEDQTSTIG